jgi:hypothetical protein
MPKARSSVQQVATSRSGAFTLRQQGTTQVQTVSVPSWTASTSTLTGVLAGSLVLAIGGWWDGTANTGAPQQTPTNSNGTFTKSGNAAPTLPSSGVPPGWPVAPEICHILNAASGNHVLTPQNISSSGDGYFFGVEFSSPGKTWTLVDSGYGFAGSLTSGAVDGVTVTTAGVAAIPGDLVVVAAALDGNPTSFGIGSPSGSWINLLTSSTSSINVAAGAAYRVCDAPGAQSATWVIADNDCNVFDAVIAVFRAS